MKIRLLVALLVLSFGLSCAPGASEPEKVASEYIKAIASDNCLRASSYWVSEHRREFYNACREARCKIVETRIDAVEPESNFRDLEQNQALVLGLHGQFLHRCDETGEEYVTNSMHIWLMLRGNDLYVSQFEEEYIIR